MRPGLLAVALLLVALPLPAFAGPRPSASASATPGADARDGGIIEGRVTGIDYARGTITVDTGHDSATVTMMPSTSVQSSDPGYHAFSDVAKGSRVQIFASRVAGKIIAQIIRLIKH